MLARFGALLEPPVRPIISATLDQMRELHAARSALVKDRTAAQNRQNNLVLALLKRQAAKRLAQIEDQLAALDAELARLGPVTAKLCVLAIWRQRHSPSKRRPAVRV